MQGLADPHAKVRWAGCQALGQLCTDLGPDLQAQEHSRVIPGRVSAPCYHLLKAVPYMLLCSTESTVLCRTGSYRWLPGFLVSSVHPRMHFVKVM